MPCSEVALKEHPFRLLPMRSSVVLVLSALLLIPSAEAQTPTETLLSTENAYNPIPSPDG